MNEKAIGWPQINSPSFKIGERLMEQEVRSMRWVVTTALIVGIILQISILMDIQTLKREMEDVYSVSTCVKDVRGDYY
jgi:hypothetical protein